MGERSLLKKLWHNFCSNVWHRVFLIEVIFSINWAGRLIAFIAEDPVVNHHPLYSKELTIIAAVVTFTFTPLKLWLLWTGINGNIICRLLAFTFINPFLVPGAFGIVAYLRWSHWTSTIQNLGTIAEVTVVSIKLVVALWGVYWEIPRCAGIVRSEHRAIKSFSTFVNSDREFGESPDQLYNIENNRTSLCTNSSLKSKDGMLGFIKSHKLSVDKSALVGKGQFGQIFQSQLKIDGKVSEIVAKCHGGHEGLDEFAKEMNICRRAGCHENIVRFYGIGFTNVVSPPNFCLVFEYCGGGNLKTYLDKLRWNQGQGLSSSELPNQLLELYAEQICAGMEYLSSVKLIHGDLACRNILLTENQTRIKICDFGHSRKLCNYQQYLKKMQNELLPWRYLSVEALEYLKFSEKSDTWSYGVTLWEIASLGEQPFENLEWDCGFAKELREGKLSLVQPPNCDNNWFSIMKLCWTLCPIERPTFSTLIRLIPKIKSGFESVDV